MYYRITKVDENMTAPNGDIIPGPTKADRKWVRDFEWNEYKLIDACGEGNLWRIQFALRREYYFPDVGEDCITAAIENDRIEVLKLLKSNDVTLTDYDSIGSLLALAVESKSSTCFEYILSQSEESIEEILDNMYSGDAMGIKLMLSQQGGVWKSATPTSINRFEYHETMKSDEIREITTTFNFKARKITTTIRENDVFAGLSEQNFSDAETDAEIIEAHEKLSAYNPDLPDISQFTNRSLKPRASLLARPQPRKPF